MIKTEALHIALYMVMLIHGQSRPTRKTKKRKKNAVLKGELSVLHSYGLFLLFLYGPNTFVINFS